MDQTLASELNKKARRARKHLRTDNTLNLEVDELQQQEDHIRFHSPVNQKPKYVKL